MAPSDNDRSLENDRAPHERAPAAQEARSALAPKTRLAAAPPTQSPLIELEDVGIQFGSNVVLQEINFKVNPGEVITILGPSGTGKTVILKLIAGLLTPTGGTVRVFGKDVNQLNESELLAARANIGMLFQGAALFDSLSVYENVAYSLRERKDIGEEEIAATVEEMLGIIGLPNIADRSPQSLSGGQKKRVGLARALARAPRVMLFDEPTTGLDPTAARLIDQLILKLKRDYGITSIVVTHDIESARLISDRWVLINKGHVVADGAVSEVLSKSQEVKDFTSGNWTEE